MSEPRRSLSLRALLATFLIAGAVYVGMITLVIELRVAPTAERVRARVELALQQHDSIQAWLASFEVAIDRLGRMLREHPAADRRTGAAVLRDVMAPVQARLDSVSAYLTSPELADVPLSSRVALAGAAQTGSDIGVSLLDAAAALTAGDIDGAWVRYHAADSLRVQAQALLVGVQRQSLAEIGHRERGLTAAARGVRRAVFWWALLGALLVAAGFVTLRTRWYRPLGRLDASLKRVASGDFLAEVPVERDDELGRLGAHFNRMTTVLRRSQEDESRRRENLADRLGHLLDESINEILVLDAEHLRVIQANRGALQNLGYTAAELASRTLLDLVRDVDLRTLQRQFASLLTGHQRRIVSAAQLVRKDGTAYPVQMDVQASLTEQPPVLLATVRDTTVRTQAERLGDALRQVALAPMEPDEAGDATPLLAEIIETGARALEVPTASAWVVRGNRLEPVHQLTNEAAPIPLEPFGPDRFPAFFAALQESRTIAVRETADDPRTAGLVEACLRTTDRASLLAAAVRVSGTLAGLLCHVHVGPPRRWSPEEEAFSASLADFAALALEAAERRRAEHSLKESEERFSAAFGQAPVGIVEIGPGGVLLRANPQFSDLLGKPEGALAGLRILDVTHPDDVAIEIETGRRLLAGELPGAVWEKRYIRDDGRVVWARVTSAPVRGPDGSVRFLVAIVEDITERRNLQAQLAQSQKMESIGRLAGGVAHDFNNLLTAILGYLDLVSSDLGPEHSAQPDLLEVRRAAERAAGLTRQLLTFARRQVVEPKVVDLNALTVNLEKMLRRLIGEDVELVVLLQPGLSLVSIDPGQFEQVLVNLAVNARDAMPNGGKLTIETADVELDTEYAAQHADVAPGPYVRLSVTDTGTGMDQETVSHLFEPFFTTKERGKGTGLGLSTCYGIVKQAGGHIGVYSEPGQGSTFKVYVPRASGRLHDASGPRAAPPAPRGHETILLVEDEVQIRTLIERTLTSSGYRVLAAANGEEALATAERHEGPIHLLVSDVILPLLGGPELAERLQRRDPRTQVLFISGYTEGAVFQHGVLKDGVRFLSKPFMPGDLVRRVREALDATQ